MSATRQADAVGTEKVTKTERSGDKNLAHRASAWDRVARVTGRLELCVPAVSREEGTLGGSPTSFLQTT